MKTQGKNVVQPTVEASAAMPTNDSSVEEKGVVSSAGLEPVILASKENTVLLPAIDLLNHSNPQIILSNSTVEAPNEEPIVTYTLLSFEDF